MRTISIRGARTHNLKQINLDIPRDKLVVITGLSGSGKSSLAFDTLYAEGQRRYVESLSTYARQFLSMMEKPDVDHIEGLSPAISIEQKSTSHNPRSTVGTITEIYDYLRLLFARVGDPHCPEHHTKLEAQSVSQIVDQIQSDLEDQRIMLLAPLVKGRKGEHMQVLQQLRTQGFVRARINGEIYDLDEVPTLDKNHKHTIDAIIDRFRVRPDIRQRLAESLETCMELGQGVVLVSNLDHSAPDMLFSSRFACHQCGYSIAELEPRLFSFNNPRGACPECDGLGTNEFVDPKKVVLDPSLSIAEGAIKGWDRRSVYYFQQLAAVGEFGGFTTDQPFVDLTDDQKHLILYGSDTTPIAFHYVSDRGTRVTKEHPFEGVITNLRRRYSETESTVVREDIARYLTYRCCPDCSGARLRKEARNVLVDDRNISSVTRLPVGQAAEYFDGLNLEGKKAEIADRILKEIRQRLSFLVNVGLEYLTLERSADSLSGGEAQRIRLASQIGAGLVGVMYILDEPSIGLHQRDNQRLLDTLFHLRDLGNSVIVVEHDEEAIRAADYVIDIGPGAGVHGGQIMAQGKPDDIAANPSSITGMYLNGTRKIVVPESRKIIEDQKWLMLNGVKGNNLKNVDLQIPLGLFTCITGVSGSGKSTLINSTLYPLSATLLNGATTLQPGPYQSVSGLEHLDKVVDIDQSPIGRTPRSNPATYTGIFTGVRELFAGTQEARSRGYKPGRFSFNVKGGRCETCQGDGVIKVEMHFLPDVYVKCDICKGERYNRETLDIRYKGKNIHQLLDMTVEEASGFLENIPALSRKLQTLMDVGLGYIRLGQPATTLSGGEAQRVKLAKELSKRDTGKTLYILDEPTTGLHFYDIQQLLDVLYRLRDRGNSVVVIEHNLDVIKTADWIVDLGPEGGDKGGQIIAEGSPETVAMTQGSYTGHYLKPLLNLMPVHLKAKA